MKIVTLSDTHGYHYYIAKSSPALPPGDVLVHAGDFTGYGKLHELIDFAKWMGKQDYAQKICIAGNHDEVAENMGADATAEIFWEHGVVYLCDSSIVIDGIKFYGTPYVPEFCNWSFMEDEYQLVKRYDQIPSNTDVLITHGPAAGILDSAAYDLHFFDTGERIRTGSEALLHRMREINNPRHCIPVHIFGHIHEGRGMDHTYYDGDIYSVNASFLNERYVPYDKVQDVVEY